MKASRCRRDQPELETGAFEDRAIEQGRSVLAFFFRKLNDQDGVLRCKANEHGPVQIWA